MKKGTWLEDIVSHLESRISPNATIELRKKLPDKNNPGHRRECDVVICEMVNKREIITIVEVQDRAKSVSIGEFTNFVQKMRDVGAIRLLVVSNHDYPRSIVDKARIIGPSVKLINLNNLDYDTFDVGTVIITNEVFNNQVNLTFSKDGFVFNDQMKSTISNRISSKEKVLLFNNKYYDYMELFLHKKNANSILLEGIHDFEYIIRAKDGLQIYLDGKLLPIAIIFCGKLEVQYNVLNSVVEYKAVDEKNPYLFMSESELPVNGVMKKILLFYEWREEHKSYKLSWELQDRNDSLNFVGVMPK
jgi:hypothetical protein